MFEKLKTWVAGRHAMALGAVGVVTAGAMVGGTAFALPYTGYDPTSAVTGFANTVGSTAGPIIIAVATALIGLYLLFWGIRYVLSFLKGHH